ncbi:MAG: hypothetical protein JO210_00355 [Acidobacteriaceae bacterium]|nr:hypothetical protein [Acidobacteriaceae bacterium]
MNGVNESVLYPLTKDKTCTFCGAKYTLYRQGDGRRTLGLLNCWYESTHQCDEKRKFVGPMVFGKKKAAERSRAMA